MDNRARFSGEGVVGARPFGDSIHATAVSICGRGLLIVGPSRSGKSRLALTMIAASTVRRPVRLIGDDRILLTVRDGALVARPHPRIEGFVERRGLGIIAIPFVAAAPIGGLVTLGCKTPTLPGRQNFPCLQYVTIKDSGFAEVEAAAAFVLGWWRDASTTPSTKPIASPLCVVKD